MVGVRAKDHYEKRQLILDRSAALFARQGFHRTSIADIAKACNSPSKAWIYHYFPNKEAVLHAQLIDFITMITARARAAIESQPDPRAQFRAFIGECLRIFDEYRVNYAILSGNIPSLSEDQQASIRALEREYAHVLRDIILMLNPRVSERRYEAMSLTMIVFGAVNWTYTWFDEKGKLSLEQLADLMTETLLGGIRAL
jgi:AcrR family transcriptional regulator